MAGEWLKFEKATPDKPEVFAIANALNIDPDAVVGKLIRVWSWFDTHTVSGNAAGVTLALLDRISGVSGFASAMKDQGWLEHGSTGVALPNFERHTGETAKGRALTAKRVAKHKESGNAKGNAASVSPALPREEKKREEIKEESKTRAAPPALPDWLPPAVWDDWHKFRNARKGWTPKARALSLAKLGRLYDDGNDPQAVIEQSIERGWTGLFPVHSVIAVTAKPWAKPEPVCNPHGVSPQKPETPEDRAAAKAAFEASLREFGVAR